MKKLFVSIFIIFVSVLGFALDLEQIDLNTDLLKEYADTIAIKHTSGHYNNQYAPLYLHITTERLFFKNRNKLPSTNLDELINEGKSDEKILAQILACYPSDNSDVIAALGDKTNEDFNKMISGIRVVQEDREINIKKANCDDLNNNPYKKAVVKIIRLQKISKELELESKKLDKENLSVYNKLSARINNMITLYTMNFNSEIDNIYKDALTKRKYVEHSTSDTNPLVPVVKISKNWFVGTTSHSIQHNIINTSEEVDSFKKSDIQSVVEISSAKIRLSRSIKLDIKAENMFTDKDLILLYIPDEQLVAEISQKQDLPIFVPNKDTTMIETVFYKKEDYSIAAQSKGNTLELERYIVPLGEPIFTKGPINKGSLIGFCVDEKPQHNNGRVVQLFTKDRIDFIQKIISEVTPNDWEYIKGKIIFE